MHYSRVTSHVLDALYNSFCDLAVANFIIPECCVCSLTLSVIELVIKIAMILDAGIDGGLLWLMVDDFNEFSAVVERLHLKRYVKNYVEQQEVLVSDRSQVQDDIIN